MGYLFHGYKSLLCLPDISKLNTNNITNMKGLFGGCESLLCLPDISKWKTNNVINMESLFHGCKSVSYLPDISKWNINNIFQVAISIMGFSRLGQKKIFLTFITENGFYLHM